MHNKNKYFLLATGTLLAYMLVIVMNFLANALPINGILANEVSDAYPNLFAPTNIAFSIWGLIFFFLALYVFRQFVVAAKTDSFEQNSADLALIAVYFILSSLANGVWVLTWHFKIIWLSVIFMLVILILLLLINRIIATLRKNNHFSWLQQWSLRIPFSLYFGWITVATIANITTFLVSIGFTGFGLSDVTWMIFVSLLGTLIAVAIILYFQDFVFGLAVSWGYLGILIRHLATDGFQSEFPQIIWTISCLLAILLTTCLIAAYREFFRTKD